MKYSPDMGTSGAIMWAVDQTDITPQSKHVLIGMADGMDGNGNVRVGKHVEKWTNYSMEEIKPLVTELVLQKVIFPLDTEWYEFKLNLKRGAL